MGGRHNERLFHPVDCHGSVRGVADEPYAPEPARLRRRLCRICFNLAARGGSICRLVHFYHSIRTDDDPDFSDPWHFMQEASQGIGDPWFWKMQIIGLATAALWLLLMAGLEGRWGRTPGKWLFGIKVLGSDLKPCGFGRAFVRNLIRPVDAFLAGALGLVIIAMSERWQRLGDHAAETVVVQADTIRLAMPAVGTTPIA
jgi:hypothetical protein